MMNIQDSSSDRGFTMLEIMIVLFLLVILLAIVLSGLDLSKRQAFDQDAASRLHEVVLGLEDYRSVCNEYPQELLGGIANGCPSGTTLADFVNVPLLESAGGVFRYASFADSDDTSASPACVGYHIGTRVRPESGFLDDDHDFNSITGLSGRRLVLCGGVLFDGENAGSDEWYDITSLPLLAS